MKYVGVPMNADDAVTTVLVGLAIAGPATIGWGRARARREDPDETVPRRSALTFVGAMITLLAWPALALWWWLSTARWTML